MNLGRRGRHPPQPSSVSGHVALSRGPATPSDNFAIHTASLTPMTTAKGHNGTITFDGHNITITRTGLLARTTHGRGEKRIPLHAITAIQWKPRGALTNGFIQFTIAGGIEKTGGKGSRTLAAAEDENSVIFSTGKQEAAMKALRDEVQAAMDSARSPAPSFPPPTQPPPPQGPPPGWYPNEGVQRWWDGVRWTEHTQN